MTLWRKVGIQQLNSKGAFRRYNECHSERLSAEHTEHCKAHNKYRTGRCLFSLANFITTQAQADVARRTAEPIAVSFRQTLSEPAKPVQTV